MLHFGIDKNTQRLTKVDNQLEIIRQSKLISQATLQKRLEILVNIHDKNPQFTVHELCEAMEVARGTFYNHIFRKADRSNAEKEKQQLMLQIQQIFDDSGQRFGSEKIRAVLNNNGIRVSNKRILEIMHELDLHSIRINAKSGYRKRQAYQKRNLVKQQFKVDTPNKIWVGDFTFFRFNGLALYVCVILDLFSRKVVGYNISKKSSTYLVTSTFRKAYSERGKPSNLTFHSDRGTQYTSYTFTKLLQDNNVKQSFSASGRPHDNAVAESFFATFKSEEAYRRDYSSEQHFRKKVDEFIRFYNEDRPHETLKQNTPSQYEKIYYDEISIA